MLTLERLKAMPPGGVFATGIAFDNEAGLFMLGTGRALRWVAVRGDIYDWAIYCHFVDKSENWIKRQGDKVHDERNIRKLVKCNKEAFKMYRH